VAGIRAKSLGTCARYSRVGAQGKGMDVIKTISAADTEETRIRFITCVC
jgi:hypothetical protein